jgi:type III secretion protein R
MALVASVGALPLIVIVATSFTKISVVLLVVRNAIGIQQTPPNMVVYAIAIALSFHIMQPVIHASQEQMRHTNLNFTSYDELESLVETGLAPVKVFLKQYSSEASRDFFKKSGRQRDPANIQDADGSFSVLIPAFLLDELTRAFEIGLMLYLPFLAIDFVVSTILIAMGMQMMSPSIISTPLKILLFVVIHGWTQLFENLVMSYPAGGPNP